MTIKTVLLYATTALLAGILSWMVAGGLFALNLLLAYLGSTLIMLASWYGIRHNIREQAAHALPPEEDGDLYDRVGNPHGILDDEPIDSITLDSENKKPRAFTLGNLLLGSKIFFSLWRLLAYGLLVLMVLALIRQESFLPWGFMLGVLVALLPLVLLILRLKQSLPPVSEAKSTEDSLN